MALKNGGGIEMSNRRMGLMIMSLMPKIIMGTAMKMVTMVMKIIIIILTVRIMVRTAIIMMKTMVEFKASTMRAAMAVMRMSVTTRIMVRTTMTRMKTVIMIMIIILRLSILMTPANENSFIPSSKWKPKKMNSDQWILIARKSL